MILADQPTIFDPEKLLAVVSSKQDGNVKYEQSSDAADNMKALVAANGQSTEQLVVMYVNDPKHWDEIHEVSRRDMGAGSMNPKNRIHADALVCDIPGVVLLLPTADCNPVIVHDPVREVVALVHLGWQSTVADLAHKVVEHLKRSFDSHPSDMVVYIGPAIKAQSYVFADPTQADDPAWQPFLTKTDSGFGIDLPGFNRQRFIDAGVRDENIQVSPIDTATSNNYFSHYRAQRTDNEADDGRFATLCMLR